MITPEQKDAILLKIIAEDDRDWLSFDAEYAGIEKKFVAPLLRQFEKKGLIEIKSLPGKGEEDYTIFVEMEADDFVSRRGGFAFEEDLFRNNFTKLEAELRKLENELPQQVFSNIMSLTSALAAGVSAYQSIKP